jgi:hypothetical protein
MTRKDIRTGIAKYFGGPTLDARSFYRPGPLTASGLSGVKAYYQYEFVDRDYVDGLTGSPLWGAVMCVDLPQMTENRLAIGGILNRPYGVNLFIWARGTQQYMETAQASMDDLIEATVALLRADPTLGGLVLQAGEGPSGISISSGIPYGEPPTETRQDAVISFTANTYPAG